MIPLEKEKSTSDLSFLLSNSRNPPRIEFETKCYTLFKINYLINSNHFWQHKTENHVSVSSLHPQSSSATDTCASNSNNSTKNLCHSTARQPDPGSFQQKGEASPERPRGAQC